MAKVFIEQSTLTAIGDAIRSKTGKTELIDPALMSEEIEAIEAGGGELPEEIFHFTGDIGKLNWGGKWDWFFNLYGNKITTSDITSINYSFADNQIASYPFVINLLNASNLSASFQNNAVLEECPKLRGTLKASEYLDLVNMFNYCTRLRDFNDFLEPAMLDVFNTIKCSSSFNCAKPANFYCCYSMRQIPEWYYKLKLCEDSTATPYSSYYLYYQSFYNAYSLDEVRNLPVWICQADLTSNTFNNTITGCYRLKSFTFETSNGSPIIANWKSQTVDLSSIGYGSSSNICDYNSGITTDKQVKDDATYQALKNDPDWFTAKIEYSRYNHDSAVETINSLPDCSATGTNTIKFKKTMGSKTDGGAINSLTAEEIAVAAAKGWTVSMV